MDYPHPLEKLNADGTIDLSHAYPARIGDWDKVAINYGYRQLPKGDEQPALTKILDDAWAKDLRYMTNQDTDAHPKVDQWSNGVNQADELNRIMKIRRAALNRLGEHTIRNGAPMATIEEPLVPIFMYHRYSVESAASMVGGHRLHLRDARRRAHAREMGAGGGSAQGARRAGQHAEAVGADGAEADARAIPPRPPGFGRHRELFPRTTGDGFDPLSPATVAADVTIGFVLELDRAARMVAQHAVDPSLPGLEEVIDRLTKAIFDAPGRDALRSGSPARRGARAGGPRDVAGDRRAQRAGARGRVAETLQAGRAHQESRPPAKPNWRRTRCWRRISSASWNARGRSLKWFPPRPRRPERPSGATRVWIGSRPFRCATGAHCIPTGGRGRDCRRCKGNNNLVVAGNYTAKPGR